MEEFAVLIFIVAVFAGIFYTTRYTYRVLRQHHEHGPSVGITIGAFLVTGPIISAIIAIFFDKNRKQNKMK